MMERPIRSSLSESSLIMMGVPKRFVDKTIKDFNDYGSEELSEVKDFITDYVNHVAQNFEDNKGIFFYGSNGVGKSFLSSIILKEFYRYRYSCRRVTFAQYINEYTRLWDYHGDEKDTMEGDFYSRYKAVEFLVLEEIGKEIDSKIAKPILEDLLRYREEHGLVTVICSNITPKVFTEEYGNSVMSLIQGNMTPIQLVGKDRRKDVYASR